MAGRARARRTRYPEWLALFEREVADRPPAAVVGEWAPRLLPGTIGAATHGLIRTGARRARRSATADTPPRRLEVATGLAFWASSYQELPGPPLLIGREGVAQALADLPYLPEDAPAAVLDQRPGGRGRRHCRRVRTGRGLARLDRRRGRAARPAGRAAARGPTCATRTPGGAIGLLHAVTSPLACEMSCRWLPRRTGPPPWATPGRPRRPCTSPTTPTVTTPRRGARRPRTDDLIERALASGDEHAIKLCEAALRTFGRSGDPVVLLAAADAAARL